MGLFQEIPAEYPWKYSTVGSWGYWNTNQGQSAAPAINSTTSSNGFLISDIDSANHWNAGQPSGNTYHYLESYFTTSSIDLSGWDNVNLEFEYSFRFNNSVDLTVAVSADSINWTNYNIQGNATNNQASADPEYLSLNISPFAGNSSVYIKIGWNSRSYFWMIDDIKIIGLSNKLFSNDFSDPSLWTMTDHANGGTQNWVIGTAAPSGSFSSGMGAIASTTASNGFAMYDSDGTSYYSI